MRFLRAVAIAVGLLLAGGLNDASAQLPGGKGAKANKRTILPPNKAKQKQKQNKQAKQAAVLERFLQMSPRERARALQQLAPARRQEILQRLNTLEMLSDEERRTLRGRFDMFLDLRQERRQAVRSGLQQLRGLTPEERRDRLASSDFRDRFSEDELRLLNEVAGQE